LARGELSGFLRAVERCDPDRRAVRIRLLVDPGHDVRDAPAVGRKTWPTDTRERIDVFGLHSPHRGATLSFSGAGVAELADAAGLGPVGPRGPWRFESSRPHQARTRTA